MKTQLDEVSAELAAVKAELAAASTAAELTSNRLSHLVFFKLKADLSSTQKADLESKLRSLANIQEVQFARVGTPEDTGDPRLAKDYDLALITGFASVEDLQSYQQNEDHLKLRAAVKDYFAGPPLVYDFWESVLLGNAVYRGNAIEKHIELHQKQKLSSEHFERWLSLWQSTVNSNFEGPTATKAIERV